MINSLNRAIMKNLVWESGSKAPSGKVNQAVGKIGLALKRDTELLSCELHRHKSQSR